MSTWLDAALDRSVVLSFDRNGFRRHSKRFAEGDLDVDLSGKVIYVTGANSGIGYATAHALAARKATVLLLCRDAGRGEAAAAKIREETGNPQALLAVLDISDLGSVRTFAERCPHERIDALIHNAGVLPDHFQRTADGLELTLATNLVGPFLLTERLLPRLGAGSRVISVSSGGMYTERLRLAGLVAPPDPFDGVVMYARTKRAGVVLTELWQREHGGRGIQFSSMHPGWADTPAVRSSIPRFYAVARSILRTPEEGADTVVWLAARRAWGPDEGGRFWFDRAPVSTHLLPWTEDDPSERAALWDALWGWAGEERR